MISLNAESCEIFNIPFFQFAQMKKFCPQEIPAIKARYKAQCQTAYRKLDERLAGACAFFRLFQI